jgi:DNA-binding MarR family transcriptional regulator
MVQPKAKTVETNGRFAYEGLERVFHEKARLGIMTSLVSQPRGVIFSDLKEMCHLTDGNLSRHLQVLNEAGLVEIWKGFHKNRPQTLCRITDEGRRRFFEYINVLETVVHDAMTAARDVSPPAPNKVNLADGWSPA